MKENENIFSLLIKKIKNIFVRKEKEKLLPESLIDLYNNGLRKQIYFENDENYSPKINDKENKIEYITNEEIDYEELIKRYIIDGKTINFNDMNQTQINELKKRYYSIITELENITLDNKYLDFAIEFIKFMIQEEGEQSKYYIALKKYEDCNKSLEQNKNDFLKKCEKEDIEREMLDMLLETLNENQYIFNKTIEYEEIR